MIDDPSLNGRAHGVIELDAHPAPAPIDPFVALPALVAALRRGRRMLAAFAAGGMAVGILLTLVLAPAHTASTTLLLGHSTQLDPVRAMATDAQLLETRVVAQQAVESLGLTLTAQDLVDSYEPIILSSDLLRLRVRASSAVEAARRADAVAAAFLAFRSAEFRRQTEVAVTALRVRVTELEEELVLVNDRIGASGAAADPVQVQELGDLLARRSTLNEQLASLRQRIEVATAENKGLILRSRVVDEAAPDPRSVPRAAAANAAAGAIAGLLAACGFLVVREIAGDRVRRRSDVARLLGAPVGASTRARRGWATSRRRHLREQLRGERHEERVLTSHLRDVVETSEGSTPGVLLTSIDAHESAAWCAALLTADLVHSGRRVLLVDGLPGAPLAHLVPTLHAEVARSRDDAIVLLPLDEALEDVPGFWRLRHEADVVVVVTSVDPAGGAEHLQLFSAPPVAVVTAGRPTSTALQSTAELLRAAGLPLRSAVVVSADATDRTTGLDPGAASRVDALW